MIEIDKMVYGGRGMGRVDGKVVFVPFTAAGDQVEIELSREKKNYAEGVLKKIEKASPLRVAPFCPLFGDCGGCQYQHLPYGEQLRIKEQVLNEILHPFSREEDFTIFPAIPSPRERAYRIRAQFKASKYTGRSVVGFYAWRSHRVVEVQECPLLHPLANEILGGLREWCKRRGEIAVNAAIQVSPDEDRGVLALENSDRFNAAALNELGKNIKGLKGAVLEGKPRISWGDLTLRYQGPEAEGRRLTYQTSGGSFSQGNPYQNRNLIQKILEWAQLTGEEKIIDLYCGSGNLTLPLAQAGAKTWGVDSDGRAINDAVENAHANGLPNCTFWAAGAEEGLSRFQEEVGSVDLAVLDPPRTGAGGLAPFLVPLAPKKILYVSCEPPTLARDLAAISKLGYNLQRVQPLDMFPQTYHFEVIAELVRADR